MEITDKIRFKGISGICLLLEQGLLSKLNEVTQRGAHLSGWHFHSLSEQPVPLLSQSHQRIFFPHIWLGFPILLPVSALCCPFNGKSVSCYSLPLPSDSGGQQLNPSFSLLPPEQTQLHQPPLLYLLLSLHNAWGQVLPGFSPLWHGLSHAGGPRRVTVGRTRPVVTVLPLGSWSPHVVRVSVTSRMGIGALYVPTAGCKVWVSTENAQEVQSSSGSTARAVALSIQQHRAALPVALSQ